MYGLNELKQNVFVAADEVECPVLGCKCVNIRPKRGMYLQQNKFFCQQHAIYISPSTFVYENEQDNLLWKEADDQTFLEAVRQHKRESRMANDNSEDALTWNIFRYLEKANQLGNLLHSLTKEPVHEPVPTYWSYSHTTDCALQELNKARLEFGEQIRRSSEPDLIAVSKDTVFWIEAKLNASNNTKPSSTDHKKYTTGGNGWFNENFNSDFDTVAVKARRYELLRLWLLGSWMATDMGKNFFLINLVKSGREETEFISHIKQNKNRRFSCNTWEQIYSFINSTASGTDEHRQRVMEYLENKSVGYDGRGRLKAAFPTLRRGI